MLSLIHISKAALADRLFGGCQAAERFIIRHIKAQMLEGSKIQYALTWPDRLPSPVPELDFAALKHLSFDVADDETFRCLAAAKKAIRCSNNSTLYQLHLVFA